MLPRRGGRHSKRRYNLGLESGTEKGLETAVKAAHNLAASYGSSGQSNSEALAWTANSIAVCLHGGSDQFLEMASHTLFNAGKDFEKDGLMPEEICERYRELIMAPQTEENAETLVKGARVLLLLASNPNDFPGNSVEAPFIFDLAAELGRLAETPEGLVVSADAKVGLGGHLLIEKADSASIISACREAVEFGERSGRPEGLVSAAKAYNTWGMTLAIAKAEYSEIEPLLVRAVISGLNSGAALGAVDAVIALFNLGGRILNNGFPGAHAANMFFHAAKEICLATNVPRAPGLIVMIDKALGLK